MGLCLELSGFPNQRSNACSVIHSISVIKHFYTLQKSDTTRMPDSTYQTRSTITLTEDVDWNRFSLALV